MKPIAEAYKNYIEFSRAHNVYHKQIAAFDMNNIDDMRRIERLQRLGAYTYINMSACREKFLALTAKFNKDARKEASFGTMFHTALRKDVDTKWAGVIWNIIHELNDDIWNNFCDICSEYFQMGFDPSDCAIMWATMNEARHRDKHGDYLGSHAYYAFKPMIELVDDETWQELDNAFKYYVEEQ